MVQLPVFDYLATFLDPSEVKALVFVSRTFAPPDPRSVPERFLAMTRRANEVEDQLARMTADRDYTQHSLEYNRQSRREAIEVASRQTDYIEKLFLLLTPEAIQSLWDGR